ncbi:DUF2220 domain-containing protein, partial [Stenotrophomonas sp. YIM B06876]|uniref:DUF2220 domain-containing protein n=1 Tax=Stenotrophomonas sp. YIM B06876 TaxID=3060211 RepID=UPI00273A39FF
ARQRVRASELQATELPANRILLIENERSLHQLPTPLPDTIAVLGSGLNLAWLAAPWLQGRSVAYWGDMDTWGLAMLATARRHLPHLHALLMDRASFDAHQPLAVAEPVHARDRPTETLLPEEAALDRHLRTLEKGRLEQEFLPAPVVAQAMQAWAKARPEDARHLRTLEKGRLEQEFLPAPVVAQAMQAWAKARPEDAY